MSQILVTGAAGFLGSYLCDELLADENEVIGMDNHISGKPENLKEAFHNDRFTYYEHDVTEFTHINKELDAVMHLASLASPVFYQEYPIQTLKVGAIGTHKTLELAKERDATYFFTSTSEVYGDPEVNPQSEDYRGNVDPYGPRSCYDESKRYGEALVRAYRDKHDLDVRVARIFNTYGPRMRLDDGRVIPNFMKQALTGKDLTVYGDGSQTRSFCYVDDMINGLIALLESDIKTPVNIGNTDERSIKELAKVVINMTESESEIVHHSLPPQDPQVRQPDISKARARLDWSPSVELQDGLKRSISYFKSHL